MEVVAAQSDADLLAAHSLFAEYAANLGVDLCFQGFQEELAGLPGALGKPGFRPATAALARNNPGTGPLIGDLSHPNRPDRLDRRNPLWTH